MANKGLSRQELRKLINEQRESKTSELRQHGYQMRFPRVEYDYGKNCLKIIYSPDSSKKMPEKKLRGILEGIEPVSDSDRNLINEWYSISPYRFSYELRKLSRMLNFARITGNEKLNVETKKKLAELNSESLWADIKEIRKKQIAYYYNEKGERLDKLYNIIQEDVDSVNLRFGCMDASVSLNCYKEDMLAKSYEISRGFFEDLKNMYDFFSELKGPLVLSKSTRIVYSNEWAGGDGQGFIDAAGRRIGLEARVAKDSMTDTFDCAIRSSEIKINKSEALKNCRLFLPDYWFKSNGDLFGGIKEESVFFALYGNGRFFFGGNAHDIEAEVPRFFEAVLK